MQLRAQPLPMGCPRTRPIAARGPAAAAAARPARRAPVARAAAAAGQASEPGALAAFEAAHAANIDECLSVLKTAATTKGVKPEVGSGGEGVWAAAWWPRGDGRSGGVVRRGGAVLSAPPPLPVAQIVEGALVWLERNTAKGPAGGGVQSIEGSWRLVYSTSTSLRFFQVELGRWRRVGQGRAQQGHLVHCASPCAPSLCPRPTPTPQPQPRNPSTSP
jgi:hypothetical protein